MYARLILTLQPQDYLELCTSAYTESGKCWNWILIPWYMHIACISDAKGKSFSDSGKDLEELYHIILYFQRKMYNEKE